MAYDYKGRPRMLSSQHGMVAADQGDCSAMGEHCIPSSITLLPSFKHGGNARSTQHSAEQQLHVTSTMCVKR